MIETLRSIVHTWECDSVEHFTTAYYFRDFSAANWRLLQELGHDERRIAALTPGSCRTRFIRELHAGDAYHVVSGVIEAGAGGLVFGHQLLNSETGALCAAHTQRFTGEAPAGDGGPTIDWEEKKPVGQVDFARLARWSVTSAGIVRVGDLDHTGYWGLDALIHHASDANVQFQNMIGMTSSYMSEQQIGFSTVEYQIAFAALPQAVGTVVEAESALAHLGRTSLWFAHRVIDRRRGAVVAEVAQFGVHLDRVARRPAEIPAHIRNAAEPRLPEREKTG